MKTTTMMTEDKVKDLLKQYGIATPKYRLLETVEEIPSLDLKFPVALKVCSSRILHKTEVGGVVLGIRNKKGLAEELDKMKEKFPEEKFLVEEMEEKGLEVIVGVLNDGTFGLCLMLGLGGVFTEILEDVSFRAIPISRSDAEAMLTELKSHRIFEGFRSLKIDRDAIVDLLLQVSQLATDYRGRIDQLDLNPVIVRSDGLSVVDAKLLLRKPKPDFGQRGVKARPDILRSFFYPQSVAVIGASANPEKDGYHLLKNIMDGGFKGPIYPINPNAPEILGLPAKKSVLDVEGKIDLAAVIIAAGLIPRAVEEFGKKGIKNVLIISSGFQEIGSEGVRISEEVRGLLEKYEMRVIGPNCQGLVNTHHNLFATLGLECLTLTPKKGRLGIFSQSGSVGIDLVQRAVSEGLGYSFWVNLGNKLDADESDIIKFMDSDPNVSVVAGYLEDIKNGEKLRETFRSLRKPLVLLKSGRTRSGQKAARSHTAALAGDDKIFDGVLKQHHIARAETTDDLFDLAKAFNFLSRPSGKKLLIVESSGGLGTLASDIAERAGLQLPDLDEETKKKVGEFLPPYLQPNNPLDLATAVGEQFVRAAQTRILDHFDALLLIFGDPVVDASKAVQEFKKDSQKPIVVVFSGGGKVQERETKRILKLGVPIYPNVERALKFFAFCGRG